MTGTPKAVLVFLLAQVWRPSGFHDDDCEQVQAIHGASVVDWRDLRVLLARAVITVGGEDSKFFRQLHLAVQQAEDESRQQCPLGWAALCIMHATVEEANACLHGLDIQRVLASRWPVFELLQHLQRKVNRYDRSCEDLGHPSIDWREFREHAERYVSKVPAWLLGLSESEAVPDEFNAALSYSQGIVWKGSSSAVAQGRSISHWTCECELGLLCANAIRAAGIVLSDGDVYRIAQRSIEGLVLVFMNIEEVLRSPWPIFGLLAVLGLLKKTLHDTRLWPSDFSSPDSAGLISQDQRSPTWRAAAAVLQRAGQANRILLLTALPLHRVNFFQPFLKRMGRLGLLQHVVVAPLLENITGLCDDISYGFVADNHPDVPADWSPCLPFLSQFAAKAQFLYMHLALQLSLTVLWFDFHVFWVQSPMNLLQEALSDRPKHLAYDDACTSHCNTRQEPADVFAVDDFYANHWPRPTILLVRPTAAACDWVELLLRWICTYPYANVKRGLHYLLHPDVPDIVPSMSMLPSAEGVPRIKRGFLDKEQRFVSTDGWFGRTDLVISYEIRQYLVEQDRVRLLDNLYLGSEERTLAILHAARKPLSPVRPTQRLAELVTQSNGQGFDPHSCSWQRISRAFLGGYAAGVEDVFDSTEAAQCECVAMGQQCQGITCEGAGGTCTLRQGEPWLTVSPTGEDSYVKKCSIGQGCNVPEVLRIVHVNFADGCCEAEQKQSSETSLQSGADETRPLRGDFLDSDFRDRNSVLLKFNRTPDLTQYKTPSGKIGYYVWKPYVVLRTVEDPRLPWDTTVIAWTDAGVHFISDMRPLIEKYLRVSDVAATRTPMVEGDFSKRDAFMLLDADYETIVETPQIATGFILVRKTKLAIEFLQRWLSACEDRRIMTEEPSVLGYPDYFTFKNNNDDQTAFSLLFKKYGFHAFSVGERDAVVYTGRNLAKFVKNSDDFALGRSSSQDSYLKAADDAAAKQAQGG